MYNSFRLMLMLFATMSFVLTYNVNADDILSVEDTLKIVDSDTYLFWHLRLTPFLDHGSPNLRWESVAPCSVT